MPSSRPHTPNQAQFDVMHNYAYKYDLQTMMNRMLSDMFSERPEDIVGYLKTWLDREGVLHVEKCREKIKALAEAKAEAEAEQLPS